MKGRIIGALEDEVGRHLNTPQQAVTNFYPSSPFIQSGDPLTIVEDFAKQIDLGKPK